MNKLTDNVKKILDEQNKSKAELARKLGIPPQTVSSWFCRKNIPTKHLFDIAQFLNTTVEGLNGEKTITISKFLPIIGRASCGIPTNHFYNDGGYELLEVPSNIYKEGRYVVEADGDSMLPRISDGDYIVCDVNATVNNGDIVHYTLNGEDSGVKKIQMDDSGNVRAFMPLNTSYDPIFPSNGNVRMAKCVNLVSNL